MKQPQMIRIECVDNAGMLYDVYFDGEKVAARIPWEDAMRMVDVDPEEANHEDARC